MKFKIALVLALFIVQPLFGQEDEPALAKIHYHFKHINDTTARDQYHDEETVLYLGQHSSFYTSYSNARMHEMVVKQIEDPAFDGSIVIAGEGALTSESYYAVPRLQTFQLVYTIMADERYIVDEDVPALDWQIVNERKEIGGYDCQKAEVNFKGRDYTAWFTTELPFQAGPWKLQGLPGLILEARDRKSEVVFSYLGFDKLVDSARLVESLQGRTKIDKKILERKIKAFKENPEAYARAHSQGGGDGTISGPFSNVDVNKIKSIEVKKGGVQKSKVTNNPIELE